MPTLFSERIMLREFRNEDFTAICAWANDEGTTRYLSTRYWIPQSEEDCANYLNEHMQNSHNAYHFVIANQADEVYMGEIDLRNVDWRLRSGVVSMLLLKRERGRGYAREALKLMEHFAFMTLGLERLELQVHADNTAARHCYEKAGFVTEGIKRHAYYNNGQFRDVVIMSMLREEYATQQ